MQTSETKKVSPTVKYWQFYVHIQNPSDTTCSEKTHYIECTECKTRAKSILYICASGHVMSRTCQNDVDGNEGGDNIPERDCGPDNLVKEPQSNKTIKTEDLASGDHDVQVVAEKSSAETNKKSNVHEKLVAERDNNKSNPETTVEYKNENYLESKSSVTLNLESCKNNKSKEELPNFKVELRPVVCPVTNCSKMVTINTIVLHFQFDHSKVPRIIINETEPQEVLIKPASISTEIQCIATYFINSQSSAIKENKFLLLMAVKLQTTASKIPDIKYVSSRVFTRSIHTQTDKEQENNKVVSTECLSKDSSDYKSCKSKTICDDDDDLLLLWLCKLDDDEKVYSITLMGREPKRGYSYIGNAIHVREKQDPSSLHEKTECLIVKRSAVNTLCVVDKKIPVIVSIVK